MRDDHAQRGGALHLARIGKEEVLDPVASVAARDLSLHAFVGVERLLDGAVAQAVNRRLQTVRGGVEHELIDLILVVVRVADILELAVGVAHAHRA